ncbi:MAG: nucleotidyltransferase family protein [Pyrinomonadaceae bacterium]
MKIGVLILAAGASQRLGEPKQLLKFEGKTLLRRAAETALATNSQKVVIVLGANAEKFGNEVLDLPVEIAVAEDWAIGMSASIRTGLKKIITIESDLSAVILLLCDQPLVTTETITKLISKYRKTKKSIVASEYNNTIGVPALFASEMFDRLFNLQGDSGARFVIKGNAASVVKILAPEAAFDIDTSADYEKLIRLNTLL